MHEVADKHHIHAGCEPRQFAMAHYGADDETIDVLSEKTNDIIISAHNEDDDIILNDNDENDDDIISLRTNVSIANHVEVNKISSVNCENNDIDNDNDVDDALWSGTNKDRDVSTGPLTRPFARSLATLTRLLAPHYSLRSRAPLRSLACSLTHFAHS